MKIKIFLFLVISLLLAFCECNNKEPSPLNLDSIREADLNYRLELVDTHLLSDNEDILAIDADADGSDEILCFSNNRINGEPSFIQIMSLDYSKRWFQKNCRGEIYNSQIIDLQKDKHKEIIFSELHLDSTIIHLINTQGDSILSFTAAKNPKPGKRDWRCIASDFQIADINHDSYDDLLFILHTTYAYQPRGICAYDIYHNRLIWQYLTGFVPYGLFLMDSDRDGQKEILTGSCAPQNSIGDMVNGTDDATAFFTVLSAAGTLKISYRFRENYNFLQLLIDDINGDGRKEVYFLASTMRPTHDAKDIIGSLHNGQISIIGEFSQWSSPRLYSVQKPHSTQKNLLICSADGSLEIRTSDLKLLQRSNIEGIIAPFTLMTCDICADTLKELIIIGTELNRTNLCIFDSELTLKSIYRLSGSQIKNQPFEIFQGIGLPNALLLQSDERIYKFIVKKQIAAYLPKKFQILLGGIFFLLTSLLIAVFWRSSKIKRSAAIQAIQTVFSNLREIVIILDQNGKVIHFNQEIVQLGLPSMIDHFHMPYQQFFEKINLPEVCTLVEKSYQENQSLICRELSILHQQEPSNFIVYVAFFPIGHIQTIGRIVLLRCVTEMVEHERELAWATMAHRLAHELKSPLTTVRLSAQQIQADLVKTNNSTEKNEKYLNHIFHQINHLSKTVDNFLKFASVTKNSFVTINLHDLLEECVRELEARITPAIHIIKCLEAKNFHVSADSQQLIIAVNNILDNSLNAMIEGGTLTVATRDGSKRSNEDMEETIQLRIIDTGRGITKENIKYLFQPFFSRTVGGTGLGLVIAQKIIKDHHGRIKIKSVESKGTAVTIDLPASGLCKNELE